MRKLLYKEDIVNIEEKIEEILRKQRKSTILITEKIDKSKLEIIATIFSENRKIREEIGYQTIILKTLEDNLSEIQIDEDSVISSKIELSVGGNILGTGVKWVLDIDYTKGNLKEILEAIKLAPNIPNILKEKLKSKIKKLRN